MPHHLVMPNDEVSEVVVNEDEVILVSMPQVNWREVAITCKEWYPISPMRSLDAKNIDETRPDRLLHFHKDFEPLYHIIFMIKCDSYVILDFIKYDGIIIRYDELPRQKYVLYCGASLANWLKIYDFTSSNEDTETIKNKINCYLRKLL